MYDPDWLPIYDYRKSSFKLFIILIGAGSE